MVGFFQFECAAALWIGVPLVFVLLVILKRGMGGVPRSRRVILSILRAIALLVLLGLLARPVWVVEDPNAPKRPLVLLLDRSRSMSLSEEGTSRYQRAIKLLRETLLPELKASGTNLEVLLFAREAHVATPQEVLETIPDGDQTNLGGAIEEALRGRSAAGVLALTDGAANERDSDRRALSGLIEAGIPFFGIGFGSEKGVSSLNVVRLDVPAVVPPKHTFTLGVQLEANGEDLVPGFSISLFRDGQLLESRNIEGFKGARFWLETFQLKEEEEGVHQYVARLVLPAGSERVIGTSSAAAEVRVSLEKEFRVLFVQGSLTWDFKFIARALTEDPTVKLTGLSRTSEQSIFRQNVEAAGELVSGFPESIEEIAKFRVVVLSDLSPRDFNGAQQETLARFCRELGGGVLLLGGPGTFGPEWVGSQLEQLLPVKFDLEQGVRGLDQAFHLQLTEQGQRHPAFLIAAPAENRAAWQTLPAFTQYGRVSEAKPGATVLAEHERDQGAGGRRILIASQRYGAGQSAVVCVQNFWRWRLAKGTEGEQFDRFWRQLLRWLGETGRKPYEISFPAQELRLAKPTQFLVERQQEGDPASTEESRVEVIGPDDRLVLERELRLGPGRMEALEFESKIEGLYRVRVLGGLGRELASRSLEVKDRNPELQRSVRDMECLHQWAGMTRGVALKVEECEDRTFLQRILERVRAARDAHRTRVPLGLNAWVLGVILGTLSLEWILRRKWMLL